MLNATKTPDIKDKETLPDSPLLLNDILTPDTKNKPTTSSNFFSRILLFVKNWINWMKFVRYETVSVT